MTVLEAFALSLVLLGKIAVIVLAVSFLGLLGVFVAWCIDRIEEYFDGKD